MCKSRTHRHINKARSIMESTVAQSYQFIFHSVWLLGVTLLFFTQLHYSLNYILINMFSYLRLHKVVSIIITAAIHIDDLSYQTWTSWKVYNFQIISCCRYSLRCILHSSISNASCFPSGISLELSFPLPY